MQNLNYYAAYSEETRLLSFAVDGVLAVSGGSPETTFVKDGDGFIFELTITGPTLNIPSYYNYVITKLCPQIPSVKVKEAETLINVPVFALLSKIDSSTLAGSPDQDNTPASGEWPFPFASGEWPLPFYTTRLEVDPHYVNLLDNLDTKSSGNTGLINLIQTEIHELNNDIQELIDKLEVKDESAMGDFSTIENLVMDSRDNCTADSKLKLNSILRSAFIKSRSVCHKQVLVKIALPKQVTIKGTYPDYEVVCRDAWTEIKVIACHPCMNHMRNEVNESIVHALVAIGAGAIITCGPSAWAAFKTVFYAKMSNSIGELAFDISLELQRSNEFSEYGK